MTVPDWLVEYLRLADSMPGLLNVGVFAAYLAVGGPSFEPARPPVRAQIDDEHDAKLAFTCKDQAEYLDSAAFRPAARVYALL